MNKPLDQDQIRMLHNIILGHGLDSMLLGLGHVCDDIAVELAGDGYTVNAKVFANIGGKLNALSSQTKGN